MQKYDLLNGPAETILANMDMLAILCHEGKECQIPFHDSLVAVIYDGVKHLYYEGYTMGGEMIPCSKERALEVIEAYGYPLSEADCFDGDSPQQG